MEFSRYENKIFYNSDDEFPDYFKCNYADWCNGENCGSEHFEKVF